MRMYCVVQYVLGFQMAYTHVKFFINVTAYVHCARFISLNAQLGVASKGIKYDW